MESSSHGAYQKVALQDGDKRTIIQEPTNKSIHSTSEFGLESNFDGPSNDTTTKHESSSSDSLLSNICCTNLRDSLMDYVLTVSNLLELLVCLLVFLAGQGVPVLLESVYDWSRPIPYQVLQDGQVLLDLSLTYPQVKNTISGSTLKLLCDYIPLALLVGVGFLGGPKRDVHSALCVYLVGYGVNALVTNSVKVYVGRFRPNFYDMCDFNHSTLTCEAGQHAVTEAQRSFPSGHSSLAFVSMTLLSLYFLGKVGMQYSSLRVCDDDGMSLPCLGLEKKLMSLLAVSPMLLAFFIGSSRIRDFMHHEADVIAGAVIGSASAFFAYGLWYPSVHSPWAGYPLQTLQQNLAVSKRIEEEKLVLIPDGNEECC